MHWTDKLGNRHSLTEMSNLYLRNVLDTMKTRKLALIIEQGPKWRIKQCNRNMSKIKAELKKRSTYDTIDESKVTIPNIFGENNGN